METVVFKFVSNVSKRKGKDTEIIVIIAKVQQLVPLL